MKITKLPDELLLIDDSFKLYYLPCVVHYSTLVYRTQNMKKLSYSASPSLFPSLAFHSITYNLPHECHFSFAMVKSQYHVLYVLLEISTAFQLKPVGKCPKGFHVSSIVLLSKLKKHRPCKIWVQPWAEIAY